MTARSAGRVLFRLLLIVLPGTTTMPAAAQVVPAWPDTFQARLRALSEIQTLDAALLASRSATLTLERWCRDHALAPEPRIVALKMAVPPQPASADQRRRLRLGVDQEVLHRRVQLRCGARVLSEADNWYVPARLTADMNRLLQSTDTPFGKVVQPLKPYRRTIESRLLWAPLPDGWDRGLFARPAPPAAAMVLPEALFEHRAVLFTKGHLPFAEVDELYQRQILAFTPPTPLR